MNMNQTIDQQFETVIGLEVHLQLDTETKIFCGCANQFGSEPNTNTCPVCLGLPGSLPVTNKKAIAYAIKIGLALNCEINNFIKFDRKNYFYPDCPKAYQISQYDLPVCKDGHLTIPLPDGKEKRIAITRAHLEEDAGKLIHDNEHNCSLVDYNRTGTPLLEIVSEPDLRSAQEAYDYLQKLKLTLQYLYVSDCDMEKGSLRCDANISIRPTGHKKFGTKAELKNMNSFKAVKTALEFEENRQEQVVRSGQKVVQETRLWDENKQMSFSMRSKEEAHDYRYFPDPDLVPFVIEASEINKVKETIPELPDAKLERFLIDYNISHYDATIIISDLALAEFFEKCAKKFKETKKICNWINGPLLKELNDRKASISSIKINSEEFVKIIQNVDSGVISNLAGKDVLACLINSEKSVEAIIEEKSLGQVSDTGELEAIVEKLINEHAQVAEQIRNGKESAVGFLVGQAMKASKGKANPKIIGEMIKRRLIS